jgi:hypothetical protein
MANDASPIQSRYRGSLRRPASQAELGVDKWGTKKSVSHIKREWLSVQVKTGEYAL